MEDIIRKCKSTVRFSKFIPKKKKKNYKRHLKGFSPNYPKNLLLELTKPICGVIKKRVNFTNHNESCTALPKSGPRLGDI